MGRKRRTVKRPDLITPEHKAYWGLSECSRRILTYSGGHTEDYPEVLKFARGERPDLPNGFRGKSTSYNDGVLGYIFRLGNLEHRTANGNYGIWGNVTVGPVKAHDYSRGEELFSEDNNPPVVGAENRLLMLPEKDLFVSLAEDLKKSGDHTASPGWIENCYRLALMALEVAYVGEGLRREDKGIQKYVKTLPGSTMLKLLGDKSADQGFWAGFR